MAVQQASTGKRLVQTFTINGDTIPPDNLAVSNFLGMPVCVYTMNAAVRSSLEECLWQMLTVIEKTPPNTTTEATSFKHKV